MKLRLFSLVVVAIIFVVGFSSCTRNYICQCTIKYSGQPGLPDSSAKQYDIRDTKSKAKSTCESNSGTYQANGITTVEDCKLY